MDLLIRCFLCMFLFLCFRNGVRMLLEKGVGVAEAVQAVVVVVVSVRGCLPMGPIAELPPPVCPGTRVGAAPAALQQVGLPLPLPSYAVCTMVTVLVAVLTRHKCARAA